MNKNFNKTLYLSQAGLVAAIYAIVSLLSMVAGLAFGPIQFRLAECLYIVFLDTPAMIPGIVLGCAITNIASPYGVIDIFIGSLASLLAAFFAYRTRNIRVRDIPLLSMAFPMLCNALIVGAEIAFMQNNDKVSFIFFITTAAEIAVSEIATTALGFFIKKILDRSGVRKNEESNK